MPFMDYPSDFNPKDLNVIHTESSTLWLKNNLIYIYSHANKTHTIEHAKSHSSYIKTIMKEKRVPMLCDVRKANPLTKELRDYYSSDEGTANCSKFAFIVSSNFSKVIANFFIRFSKIKYPIKMFNNVSEAEQWCKNDLDE